MNYSNSSFAANISLKVKALLTKNLAHQFENKIYIVPLVLATILYSEEY